MSNTYYHVNNLRTMFTPGRRVFTSNQNYLENNVCQSCLKVKVVYNREFFLPTIGMSESTNIMQNIGNYDELSFYFPLSVSGRITAGTADSFMQKCACCSDTSLVGIKLRNGSKFYVHKGIILNESWEPLMITGYNVIVSPSTTSEGMVINPVKPILLLSPRVFSENNIVTKAIKEILIPTGGNYSVPMFNIEYRSLLSTVTTIVDNIDDYIIKPHVPENYDTLNDDIWDCLNKNKNDLV